MQIATFVIAVFGAILATASLTWQIATFLLSGRRVKADLHIGAWNGGNGLVSASVRTMTPDALQRAIDQGFPQPVIGVKVRNVGRLPVTVTDWRIATDVEGMSLRPIGMSIGADLPHRLEAGDTETWMVSMEEVDRLIITGSEVFKVPKASISVWGEVGLGDGRTIKTKERMGGGKQESATPEA